MIKKWKKNVSEKKHKTYLKDCAVGIFKVVIYNDLIKMSLIGLLHIFAFLHCADEALLLGVLNIEAENNKKTQTKIA